MEPSHDKILSEAEIYPYSHSQPYGEKVLVLAPHPDDESLGCGGALRLLRHSNNDVNVLFLTSGDKAEPSHPLTQRAHEAGHITDYSLLREREAQKALKRLRVREHSFLRFPDREVFNNYEELSEILSLKCDSYDTIYAPSPLELNPDHRATAALALDLQRKQELAVVFYEVTIPLRPNILVDITDVIKKKWNAIKLYRSQLKISDYLAFNSSLNRFRALTLGRKVKYAESFLLLKSPADEKKLNKWFAYKAPIFI